MERYEWPSWRTLPPLAGQIIVEPPLLPSDVVDGRSALAGNGASFVAAHACSDLLAPERVDALVALAALHLHELGAEDTEGQLTVLELRTLGLRPDQQAGRKMPYLDGRVALVPVLAARPRAAAGGDLHLAILDTDFFRPGNPHYGDCDGAGLDSAASLVRGYPLPAVSSGLIFEHLVGKGTFDIENCDPWTKVQQVHSETVLLAPTRIDAGLLDDQGLCVLAALCCPDLNNDAVHNPYSLAHCCGFSNGILLDFELPRLERVPVN